jgi:sterol desaturase/sphingolipid hydroxylase (fatty acid hydroxylase superfamily)
VDSDGRETTARAIFRHAFVPVVMLASAASWRYHEELERLLKAAAVRIDSMSLVLLSSLVIVWLAEQAYPRRSEWNYHLLSEPQGWSRLGRDLVYLFVVTQLTAVLIKLTESGVSPVVKRLGFGLGVEHAAWPTAAPVVVRVLLAFFLVELCSYWMHRAFHHFPILWRFHRTHHGIGELNGMKSLRVHPVDNALFYVARTVPLMFLGAGLDEVLTVTYFSSTLSILAHANIDVAEGPLRLLVNYPRYHSVHHSSVLAESNSNFGCHTVLWDRVFGTFRSAAAVPLTVGVAPVGPRTLWQELVWPFYRAVG